MLPLLLLLACDDPVAPDVEAPAPDTPAAWEPPQCDASPVAHGLRRLTRTSYHRAVRDLLGEDGPWGDALPGESGGFEGWPGAQPTTPALVDAWMTAASVVADAILERRPITTRYEAEDLTFPQGEPIELTADLNATWWGVSLDRGDVVVPIAFDAPVAGDWRMSARAVWTEGYDRIAQAPMLYWAVDGWHSAFGRVDGQFDTPSDLTWIVPLTAGPHALELVLQGIDGTFTAVALDHVEITAPAASVSGFDSPLRRRFVPCDPDEVGAAACATTVLTPIVRLAWRRAPEPELPALVGVVTAALDDGGTFDEGLRDALRAVFASPHFLYRVEDTVDLAPGASRPATPLELADRLAALLWASHPDDALLTCALDGALGAADGPCSLTAQIERMLADPRADALSYDFARQWLGLDLLASFTPAAGTLDDATRAAMATETYATLEAARRDEADLLELVDADWTVVDPTMAAFYGLPSAGRVPVAEGRRGLLGHAGVLAMTSLPDRTSPVLRGKWLLDRLLCDPPDPPPDGVPVLPPTAAEGDVASILEAHRANPACASCHDRIDPLGVPLEGFDHLGRSRDAYPDGTPVQTAASLPDGAEVDGLASLTGALRADPAVRRCVAERFAAWALERPVVDADACLVDTLAGDPAAPRALHDLVRAIAADAALTTVVGP